MDVDKSQIGNVTFNMTETKNKSRRGSVLFNIRPSFSFSNSSKKKQHLAYEEKLRSESAQWHQLVRAAQQTVRNSQDVAAEMDENLLNEEQLVFCASAPDFEKFQAESRKFCLDAELLLRMDADLKNKKNTFMPSVLKHLDKSFIEIGLDANLLQLPPPNFD